jgi:catechol 2,3-dioxygenase
MIKLLSHLAHIEVTAPDVEASVKFYEEQVGLTVFGREGGKVYLRCWGDYYNYSLVIGPGEQPSLAAMAWRTSSAEALDEAAKRIEAEGIEVQWSTERLSLGKSFRFVGPYGHTMELFWEVEKFRATGDQVSIYPDRPERRSRHAVAPRQLDHVTVFTVVTTNEKSHDLGIVLDGSTVPGRINHYAFWVDTREDLLQAADILMENGTDIEYGPSIHGIGEQNFLYFRDPSTLRIEVNTGGYRNYVPDWEPNVWKPSQGSNNFYRNSSMPMSMTESFPPADMPSATEEGIHPDTREALLQNMNPYSEHGRG